MLLDHADFTLQEQAEDNLMVAFSWAQYNGSYTMAVKPINSLELHYSMIQFLIILGNWNKLQFTNLTRVWQAATLGQQHGK